MKYTKLSSKGLSVPPATRPHVRSGSWFRCAVEGKGKARVFGQCLNGENGLRPVLKIKEKVGSSFT